MKAAPDPNTDPCHFLWIDASRCIGCFACEVACKMEHDLPEGPRPIRIIQVGPLDQNGELVMSFQPRSCRHCNTPACVAACPREAMQKRADHIVFSDPEVCIGCQHCAIACPFGMPQLNPGQGKIAKCDGCIDRVEKGLSPACVLACPTEAISFMNPIKRGLKKRRRAAALKRRFSAVK